VADAVDRRADKIMLDFASETVAVRYQIDGVWHESDAQDRETGDETLAVFKQLAALDIKERRKRQEGHFRAGYKNNAYNASLVAQGTKNGERVIIHLTTEATPFKSLSDLGMREKMQERLKELLGSSNGLVLFSAVPGGGLTTTMLLALKQTDRYLRDFMALQDVHHPEPLAENIDLETYDLEKESAEKRLVTVLRKDPQVVIVHDLVDAKVGEILCKRAAEDKLIISSIRAKEAVEALLRVLLLKVSARDFAPAVIAVLNQRLVRKLCEACKEAYAPAPDMLKKLNIPQGRVEALYRPPQKDEQQPVCEACDGIGYMGRTSIFELLVVDDAIREALIKQPKMEVLRKMSRQSGNRTLQEEGVVLVAQGVTSLPELTRALKN
jgi:type II secretory ATPase GspE/PulE/Tfp pilus assembly ATPase PilB-like protein